MTAAVSKIGENLGPKEHLPERKVYTDSSSDDSETDANANATPVARAKTADASGNKSVVRTKRTVESLGERGRIPNSLYISVLIIILLQSCSGMYQVKTLQQWWASVTTSSRTIYNHFEYLKDLMNSIYMGDIRGTQEYVIAAVVTALVASLVGIFFWAPLRAGVWTGQRASRHKMHRYMGLLFLIQYTLAWVEFLTDYRGDGSQSFLTHSLAINGVVQAYSAYFSFKVLPKGVDAGYYSDKGVLSRDFIHENAFFQMMCLFGSVYYDSGRRELLRSTLPGKFVEILFIFFPYAIVRPFFPVTSFNKAATRQKNTRSSGLERFYEIGTTMIKIFYLWAKYFLGFHINFMVFLGIVKPQNQMFVHGLYLLNLGTVSLGVFLHTLRFKKILPAWFTFSVYLCQIYATFTALPYAIDVFGTHPKLCLVSLAGFLLNMTRSKKLHACWSVGTMLLLVLADIEW
ncbi:expressed unknown protein [Seminavis robusta]|uniref:Uncharacterized protein n=1 Tax=Seminavis robusta TaxID=568900 RepID=A0A9N8DQH8_9STRA|nr:expressed unknown protein [Seminavis robusta]|eukprot:Sro185_g080410.1 n/a (459) ;mRNA; f:69445-71000